MKSKLHHALPLIVWMGVILTLTLQTGEVSGDLSGSLVAKLYGVIEFLNIPLELETFHWLIRKAAHVSEYTVFGLLAFYAFKAHIVSFNKKVLIVLVLGVAFASVDEFIQTFVPGRAGQVVDVFIDSIGLFIAIAIVLLSRLITSNYKKGSTQL